MSEMVGKVSLQQKIAELERRIVALERGPKWQEMNEAMKNAPTQCAVADFTKKGPFGEHWAKMWHEFNEVMKAVFP